MEKRQKWLTFLNRIHPHGRHHLLVILGRRIILRRTWKKLYWPVWAGYIWQKSRSNGRLLWTQQWTFAFSDRQGIS